MKEKLNNLYEKVYKESKLVKKDNYKGITFEIKELAEDEKPDYSGKPVHQIYIRKHWVGTKDTLQNAIKFAKAYINEKEKDIKIHWKESLSAVDKLHERVFSNSDLKKGDKVIFFKKNRVYKGIYMGPASSTFGPQAIRVKLTEPGAKWAGDIVDIKLGEVDVKKESLLKNKEQNKGVKMSWKEKLNNLSEGYKDTWSRYINYIESTSVVDQDYGAGKGGKFLVQIQHKQGGRNVNGEFPYNEEQDPGSKATAKKNADDYARAIENAKRVIR